MLSLSLSLSLSLPHSLSFSLPHSPPLSLSPFLPLPLSLSPATSLLGGREGRVRREGERSSLSPSFVEGQTVRDPREGVWPIVFLSNPPLRISPF